MTKVEKMKIEGYIDILEDEIKTTHNLITSVEFFVKQLKRYIKECEVKSEESEDD